MPSTYSSLKIQLMATGENSGTWGNVTNVNLGTALEEAIVGSADVTFASGNVTLTLTDTNASQTARNLRLNLTGTTAGARDLIVPAIEKIYLVNNGCADAVTVKNSTGSGIAVPAGRTMWVYNNGTNVVDAVTHLTSLTLGSALPIASGGTGTTSTTFCNLQTNVTGTLPNANTTASSSNGASTIVARDASGNFTANNVTATNFIGSGASLTSLNASNITSGILDVADGGTGRNTLTANAVITGNATSAVNFVSPGSSGNVLTSNGTAWISQAVGGGFDAGTRMIFAQTAAPTGWTKDTTNYNNHALRVVTGTASTGGTVDFTTAFASQTPSGSVSITSVSGSAGATTLTTPQIPSHTHSYTRGGVSVLQGSPGQPGTTGADTTGATGGGGSHTHPFSFSSGSGTFTGNAINLAVKYLDVITATKN